MVAPTWAAGAIGTTEGSGVIVETVTLGAISIQGLPMISSHFQARYAPVFSVLVATTVLLSALLLHLVPALLAGMLVFLLVNSLSALLSWRIAGDRSRVWATGLIAVLVVSLLALGFTGLFALISRPDNGVDQLWERLIVSLHSGRSFLPIWITAQFPENVADLKELVMHWLNVHTSELSQLGKETGITLAQILVGMVIGGMIATQGSSKARASTPLVRALLTRVRLLQGAFTDVVGAQFKIALINAALTGVFLAAFLPALGIQLPLVKTLVVITLVIGMVPVLGNVISNTLIVMVGLSVSMLAAALSLGFLIVLHKGEYFLNARIVGHRIDARSWELLLAILVMEAAFGLPGIAAAPIFYAYLKRELTEFGWM
jgi:predicted PurR-regulated permease PerM